MSIAERREAQATYWEAVAREHLDEANLALRLAYEWRQGKHDDRLTEELST